MIYRLAASAALVLLLALLAVFVGESPPDQPQTGPATAAPQEPDDKKLQGLKIN